MASDGENAEFRWMLDIFGTDRHRYQSRVHDCDGEGCRDAQPLPDIGRTPSECDWCRKDGCYPDNSADCPCPHHAANGRSTNE